MTPYDEQREAEKLREYRRGMRDVYRGIELSARAQREFYDELLGITTKPEGEEK